MPRYGIICANPVRLRSRRRGSISAKFPPEPMAPLAAQAVERPDHGSCAP